MLKETEEATKSYGCQCGHSLFISQSTYCTEWLFETTTDLLAFVLVHHTAIGLPHVLPQVTPIGQQPFTCVSACEGNSSCQNMYIMSTTCTLAAIGHTTKENSNLEITSFISPLLDSFVKLGFYGYLQVIMADLSKDHCTDLYPLWPKFLLCRANVTRCTYAIACRHSKTKPILIIWSITLQT